MSELSPSRRGSVAFCGVGLAWVASREAPEGFSVTIQALLELAFSDGGRSVTQDQGTLIALWTGESDSIQPSTLRLLFIKKLKTVEVQRGKVIRNPKRREGL